MFGGTRSKTRKQCSTCNRPVCTDHAVTITLCPGCNVTTSNTSTACIIGEIFKFNVILLIVKLKFYFQKKPMKKKVPPLCEKGAFRANVQRIDKSL